MELMDSLKRLMMAGLGVPEKLKEITDDLVKKGEISESQGAKLVREWTDRAEKSTSDLGKTLEEVVEKTLEKMNIPSKKDFDALRKEVKSLEKKIKDLQK